MTRRGTESSGVHALQDAARREQDFELRLLRLIALLTAIFVGPFAVFRLIEGSVAVALVDALIVAVALGAALWASRTGNVAAPGLVVSILLAAGAVFATVSLGIYGLLWVYPLIMFVVHLAPPAGAFLICILVVALPVAADILSPGAVFTSSAQIASFLTTGITVTIFSTVFANRIRRHRKMLVGLASEDALTGLGNRRSFESEIQIAVATKDRLQIGYGLLILDIDRFKGINDRWGHREGDRLLHELARLVRGSVRLSDRCFRYGGDEIALILPDTRFKGLLHVCTKIVERPRAELRCHGKPVTVSIGAAELVAGETAESWFNRADAALLRAKQEGKDRFVIDAEPPAADFEPVLRKASP